LEINSTIQLYNPTLLPTMEDLETGTHAGSRPLEPEQMEKDDQQLPVNTEEEAKTKEKELPLKALGWIDRLLALWILLAMIVGILLGNFVDSVGPSLQKGQLIGVSIPIGNAHPLLCVLLQFRSNIHHQAIGLLVMIYPILCKVQYETLHKALRSKGFWVQLGFSLVMNWIVAPFLMVSELSRIRSNSKFHMLITVAARSCLGVLARQRRPSTRIGISRLGQVHCNGNKPIVILRFIPLTKNNKGPRLDSPRRG